MADRRAPWWLWAFMAASFLLGLNGIAAPLLNPHPWWSWLPHLLLGVVLVVNAGFLFAEVRQGRRRRWKKKHSLPPL
ncbi:hypothetical protein [Streptomyces sp. Ag109_O5-10]|uniref:hypothetical protein n=1 Tax=Streptomyces sp. Ag109_O5-10 TaxID=1855349 RepID=UPI00089C4250|nr:hypothetical protein [Streptomyces sp. Ag109_O5-10]SEE74702.1 hypothetical protein SAMN05216533_3518 [Streptomyces sp. Ag109_O5-10]